MNVTVTAAPKSALSVRIEVPPERLDAAITEAVRHLSQRNRIPGFRPGKAPRGVLEAVLGKDAVMEEAMDHLVQRAYRDAMVEKEILPLTQADVNVEQGEEGKPVIFTANVQVRPDVTLGDYKGFNFKPEIETIDDAKVQKVVDELRDQNASLGPVIDRGAKNGDFVVIGYTGSRDGVPFEGGSSDRMPLILGEERLIPVFEAHVVGLKPGESKSFEITFPEDYPEASLAGQTAKFDVELKELREKIVPPEDDDFAKSLGQFEDLAGLRAEIKARLERNALDRARHEVADKTEADLHADFHPRAEKRVKVLLVLSKVAETEGLEIPDRDVEAEVRKARARYASDRRTMAYFESERGRSFIRSTLRRSRLVEKLVDDWLAAHPEHPPLPHVETDEPVVLEPEAAAS